MRLTLITQVLMLSIPLGINNFTHAADDAFLLDVKVSAENGEREFQYMLGNIYNTGTSSPQNYIKAYVWFSVSAAQGHEDAKNNRDIVAAKLTPQDLSTAQAIATKCFESNYKDCE